MEMLNHIVVTDIETPVVVHSEKGKNFQMKNRRSFGLSLCVSGQITYTMNGKSYKSKPGNVVLLPQGGTYYLYGDKEGLFPVVNFKCENFECREITVFQLENEQAFLKDFEAFKGLFLRKENHLKIYSAFYGLLSKISMENSIVYNPLRPALEYIEGHISDSALSNSEIANVMDISEVYLRKLFITYQNCTPKQYVLSLRIRKAKHMLVDTPHSVTRIAEECGFGSLYHFCRAFKEKTGFTPTEYANLNRIYQI
jgi:AraC-like DNA-binding protein